MPRSRKKPRSRPIQNQPLVPPDATPLADLAPNRQRLAFTTAAGTIQADLSPDDLDTLHDYAEGGLVPPGRPAARCAQALAYLDRVLADGLFLDIRARPAVMAVAVWLLAAGGIDLRRWPELAACHCILVKGRGLAVAGRARDGRKITLPGTSMQAR